MKIKYKGKLYETVDNVASDYEKVYKYALNEAVTEATNAKKRLTYNRLAAIDMMRNGGGANNGGVSQ